MFWTFCECYRQREQTTFWVFWLVCLEIEYTACHFLKKIGRKQLSLISIWHWEVSRIEMKNIDWDQKQQKGKIQGLLIQVGSIRNIWDYSVAFWTFFSIFSVDLVYMNFVNYSRQVWLRKIKTKQQSSCHCDVKTRILRF